MCRGFDGAICFRAPQPPYHARWPGCQHQFAQDLDSYRTRATIGDEGKTDHASPAARGALQKRVPRLRQSAPCDPESKSIK